MSELFYITVKYFTIFYFLINVLAFALNIYLIKKIYDINPLVIERRIYSIIFFISDNDLSIFQKSKQIFLDLFLEVFCVLTISILQLYSTISCIRELFIAWNNYECNYFLSHFNWNYKFVYETRLKNMPYYHHQFTDQNNIQINITRLLNPTKNNYFTLLGNTKKINSTVKFDIKSNELFNIYSNYMNILLGDYFYKFYENNNDEDLKKYYENNSFEKLEEIKKRYPKIVLWAYKVWGNKIKEKPDFFIDIQKKSELNNLSDLIESNKKINLLLKDL